MKRLECVLAVLTLTFLLTGCGTTVSEEQNRIMAEYAADLLLEYDANYQSRLLEAENEPDIGITTEEPTEDVTTEAQAPSTEPEPGSVGSTAASYSDITDIADILGLEGISITYADCSFVDSYPSEQEGPFIDLQADEGYKLVVVRFHIRNQSSQDVEVDLLHTQLEYQLLMNGSKSAKPMLTILTEDMGTFHGTIAADSEQPAVLVFQMSEALMDEMETLNLRITYQEQGYVIHVQ